MLTGNYLMCSVLNVVDKVKEIESHMAGVILTVGRVDKDVEKLYNFINGFMPKFVELGKFCIRLEELCNKQSEFIEKLNVEFSQKIKELEKKIKQNNNFSMEE